MPEPAEAKKRSMLIPEKKGINDKAVYYKPRIMSGPSARVGFWSAALTTVLSIAFTLITAYLYLTTVQQPWTGIETYMPDVSLVQMLPFIFSFFLAPAFVVLMASIHHYSPDEKKIWSRIGLSFAMIYAAIVTVNYLIQVTVVRHSLYGSSMDGLSMFVSGNPMSIFWAMVILGYAFMCLSMLFASPIFVQGDLENYVRWIFVVNGLVTGVAALVYLYYAEPFHPVILASLVLWCVTFPIATSILAILFTRVRNATL